MRDRTINRESLRNLRVQAGLGVNQLASRIGCSESHLYHVVGESTTKSGRTIELGDILIHRTAKALSEALGREVRIEEFTQLTGAEDERAAS